MNHQQLFALVGITLGAAVVNGALGYGFSSITMPIALLFLTNRILNPAMVLVELVVNSYTLLANRGSVPRVWPRVWPVLCGILPGVALGSFFLSRLAPDWIKLATYAALLPLILLQAGGIRRAIGRERAAGLPFGTGVGLLYASTTISGPPLAVFLNNQGYVKQEFRAALGLIRTTEALLTAVSYFWLGLYSVSSGRVLGAIVPSVLIGILIGHWAIRRLDPETFRRVCMSFDAWIVGFGLCKVVIALHLASAPLGYAPLAAVAVIDFVLLARFFARRKRASSTAPAMARTLAILLAAGLAFASAPQNARAVDTRWQLAF